MSRNFKGSNVIFTFQGVEITAQDHNDEPYYDLPAITKALQIDDSTLKGFIKRQDGTILVDGRIHYQSLGELLWSLAKQGNPKANELVRQLLKDSLYA